MQPLRGDVEVDPAVLAGYREPGLCAHLGLILHASLITALNDHVACGLGVTRADPLAVQHVAQGVDRLGVGRDLAICKGLARNVVDHDRRGGPPGGLGVISSDSRHRLSHEPDDVPRETGWSG